MINLINRVNLLNMRILTWDEYKAEVCVHPVNYLVALLLYWTMILRWL